MKLLGILVSLTALATAQTPFANATLPIPTTTTKIYNYTPVGLGSTETMQVNIVNLATNPSVSLAGASPAAMCNGTVAFLNAGGTPIGAPSSFAVGAGQTFTATLPFTKAGIAGIRGEIRVQIQTTAPVKNAPGCSLESSLETYDSVNGASHIYLSNAAPQAYAISIPGLTFTNQP